MSAPKNKLLVLGSGGLDNGGSSSSSGSSGQHTLAHPARFLACLMAGGEQREEEEEQQQQQHQHHQGPSDGSVVPWTIDTKYYKAELALHLAAVAESPNGGQAKQEEDTCPFTVHGEGLQGVIVVCKGSVSPGEDEMWGLTKIEPWLQAASAQDSLELCLVVGVLNNDSEGSERPAVRALKGNEEEEEEEEDSLQRRRSLWCLEYGFEYVEVDYKRQVRRLPVELREKEGLERVRECIEATSWQHMDMHPSGGSSSRRVEKPDEKAKEQPPEKAGSLASDGNDVKVTCGTRLGHGSAAEGAGGKHKEEGEDDAGLEELFARLRAVRESAHSGQYDDEQRRARAAEMALQFAQKLGIFDEFEEDEV